jgi:hypothetical protein
MNKNEIMKARVEAIKKKVKDFKEDTAELGESLKGFEQGALSLIEETKEYIKKQQSKANS